MNMTKFDDMQMFYKVKTGKSVFLMPPQPKDSRVLDEDVKDTEARIKKGKRGDLFWDDPYAMATQALIDEGKCQGGDPTGPPWGAGDFARGSDCAAQRDRLAMKIQDSMRGGKKKKKSKPKTVAAPTTGRTRSLPIADMMKAVEDLAFEQDKYDIQKIMKEGCGCNSDMDIEKVSDQLATLMSAAAGWALSDNLTRGRDDHLKREWELHHKERSERERREEERRERRRRRMRKSDGYEAYEVLENFFMKDHAPVPPRQGLMWDPVKHRWTRQENIGRTVTEVQGSKRFRGTGTGVHERSVGGHGTGSTRRLQEGRRFRGVTDVGRSRPHETSHPATRGVKGHKGRQMVRNKGHKKSYLSVLREHRNKQKRRNNAGRK